MECVKRHKPFRKSLLKVPAVCVIEISCLIRGPNTLKSNPFSIIPLQSSLECVSWPAYPAIMHLISSLCFFLGTHLPGAPFPKLLHPYTSVIVRKTFSKFMQTLILDLPYVQFKTEFPTYLPRFSYQCWI